jgi:hypothetical protein
VPPTAHSASILVTHPFADPSDIARGLALVPTFTQTAGMPRTTPRGRPVSGKYSRSYCCFYVRVDTDLSDAATRIARYLQTKADLISGWVAEGARVSAALSANRQDCSVLMNLETLRIFADIAVAIEIAIHAVPQQHGSHYDNSLEPL